MMPDHFYEEDFLVIDASLDSSIFPTGISHGLYVFSPQDEDHFSINAFDHFPEIDYEEFKDHI